MSADLVIRNAEVFTPEGFVGADLVVADGRIADLVPRGAPVDDAEQVEASGAWVTPGFIDLHAHCALRAFDEPTMAAKLSQGFTTQLICPDGLGPAPVDDAHLTARRSYLAGLEPAESPRWGWRGFDEYLSDLDACHPASDMAACVPHSAVRQVVMGDDDRAPTAEELVRMQELADRSLAGGGRAISFGMIYAPGLYARQPELQAMAQVAAKWGVPLVPHVRNEASECLAAMTEFIDACRATGAQLHVSHLKLIGNAHLLEPLLALLAGAAGQIPLTVDQYPYGAGSTVLSALLPPWANDGGPSAALARCRDRDDRRRMATDMHKGLAGWENIFGSCGAENITITQAVGAPEFEAQTLAEAADRLGTDPALAVMDILDRTGLDSAMIDHYASEDVVAAIYRESGSLLGSDGVFNPSPHPRLYGSTGRFLGRLAIRDGHVTPSEAIERMTQRSAEVLHLPDRGRIARGLRADLVVLDPAEFVDRATFADPCEFTAGVRGVWVAGQKVWDGTGSTGVTGPTGNLPGRVVR
ncbi:D-aminoacylase [Brooklawnia cerclae]|uniref:N-acyl-D-amino-acid deacylase n=1 Tax=Brooklawnia cerclae TaxID=349934 RepID=A0ABX0SEA6_9ACTN|nr:amidohydrolase family protein [Brooklawnia cerclae]NIH56719.1 N-acyl-D-amino-acid deacylase [Brooklawnia cerclae]